jgi:hypothetical protein
VRTSYELLQAAFFEHVLSDLYGVEGGAFFDLVAYDPE